ncbi:MAG: hypothetical protein PHI32_12725 [Dysgonamonadaceae bacterium]|nr:hypothetical protein [Dysgonamonadaceae bacterium]MDD4728833.1 hypothetical protein [Dysgonamonadaceae bacterium]
MDNIADFLRIEEESKKLSDAIKNLYSEVGSYKNAKEELNITREKLCEFLQKTDELVSNSHKIIDIMVHIGMPQVIDTLEEVKTENVNNTNQIVTTIEQNNDKIIEVINKKSQVLLYTMLGGFFIFTIIIFIALF